MSKKNFIIAIIILIITALRPCCAEDSLEKRSLSSYLKGVSYFTGFSKGELEGPDTYKIVPLIIRFGVDLDEMGIGAADIVKYIAEKGFGKSDLPVKGATEFLIEPFLNAIISPDGNIEVGFDLLVKYSYPVTEKIHPYFFTGGGVVYMTQKTREQSTQYNFIPQMGGGVSYYFKKDTALSFEYRYRHLSNANIKEPNEGINMNMFLMGITYEY